MKCDIPFYVEYSDYLYHLHCWENGVLQVQVVNVPEILLMFVGRMVKFWVSFGGEEDTDATDSTIDPESDSELQRVTSQTASQYLVSDTVKKGKRGRLKKQRSPKDMQNTSSEHTQTRSKNGVIKSNPKYMWLSGWKFHILQLLFLCGFNFCYFRWLLNLSLWDRL